jgi:serine/threonine protein kinase/Tol biopolymer transport system component
MAPSAFPELRFIRFGPFELDVRAGELRKHGTKIKLREQPVRILLMLLEKPGEIVLRDEIRQRLWPNNTIVEFDHGINAAIQKLRDALLDSAAEPRYVETVARRGYRFIAQAEKIGGPQAAHELAPEEKGLHYRLLEKLGEGGMGVVYRAEDLKLGRIVAVKCLPSLACELPETVLRRFEREARAAAVLNHPNICTVHGFEQIDGQPAIVMELVEGETLEHRLARGPLLKAEALSLSIQIAGALGEAHRKGVVHRDLKPGNIMLTKSGAKVLDFGLALVELPADENQSGAVTGTMGFMSPEQAQGRQTDARSDIFSFGVVLYEMLSGTRPFQGNSAAGILAALLERDPPPLVPAGLDRIVRRCLAKDPNERWQSANDLKASLVWFSEVPAEYYRPKVSWIWGTVAFLTLILGALGSTYFRVVRNERPAMTLTVVPPAGVALREAGNNGSAPEVFPDGSAIAYCATEGCYVRQLASPQPHLIPGSESNSGALFVSPDSKTVVIPVFPPGEMKKVRMPDGAPQTVAVMPLASRGGSWSDRGTILVSSGERLFYVPAEGGELKRVEMPQELRAGLSFFPQFLPGGEDFLFLHAVPDDAAIYLATFRDGKLLNPSLLFKNSTAARYTPAGGGRILFVRGDNLYWQKLNRSARRLTGEPVLIVQGVASQPSAIGHAADFSVARDGTIAWRSGKANVSQLGVFGRTGSQVAFAGPLGPYMTVKLSPDEKQQLLISAADTAFLVEERQPGILALPKDVKWYGWTDGGKKVAGLRGKMLVEMSASGTGDVHDLRKLDIAGRLSGAPSFSADGKKMVFATEAGIFVWQFEGTPEETKVILVEKKNGRVVFGPSLSPDNRWVIYTDSASGGGIFVRSVLGQDPRRQISASGRAAAWRADGKEIVYWDNKNVMAVSVESIGGELHFGEPHALVTGLRPTAGLTMAARPLAISRDGSRVFYLQGIAQPEANMIQIKTGFFK